jgi:hypothetical protein
MGCLFSCRLFICLFIHLFIYLFIRFFFYLFVRIGVLQDDKHICGIWRKTTLESYRTATPEWRTVIDVDALPPPVHETAKTCT